MNVVEISDFFTAIVTFSKKINVIMVDIREKEMYGL